MRGGGGDEDVDGIDEALVGARAVQSPAPAAARASGHVQARTCVHTHTHTHTYTHTHTPQLAA